MLRFLFLVFLLISACSRESQNENNSPLKAREESFSVVLTETRWGEPVWQLKARKVENRKDTILVYSPEVIFFSDSAETSAILISDSGKVYPDKDMKAMGHVRVITASKAELCTKTLFWNNKTRRIETRDSVTIKSQGRIIKGKGLNATPDLSTILIGGEVKGEIK